jgi:DNA-binding transcriptional MerR regulator
MTKPAERTDTLLTIGVFARRSRLSMKALRLSDRLGLLRPADVDPDNAYRRYRQSQLAVARLIAMLRRLDMPLAQVADVVSATGPHSAALLASYWDSVERRVAGQRELASHLRDKLSGREDSLPLPDVQVREVPEQLVLSEQRHVQAPDLPAWIGAAMKRLITSAARYGGMSGFPFVVYYGEVNEDSDGPAEACVPIANPPVAPDSDEVTIRREPEHREAYLRLRKAQVAFPQILSAYDGVARWAGATGVEVTGAPREIYFTDFASAAPSDDVCDVAFPVR